MRAVFEAHADPLDHRTATGLFAGLQSDCAHVEEVKKEATHLKHFSAFSDLQQKVGRALLHFAQTPSEITVLMARYGEKLGQVGKAA